MEIKLSYTSAEAFQMAKDAFPETWKEEIEKHKAILLRLKRTYKKDLIQSYQHYLNMGCRQESAILMLAAVYFIRQEERNYKEDTARQVHDLEAQKLQYSKQFDANETAKNITDFDKKTLRSFYKKKQAEIQKTIDELLASFEVNEPTVLTIQTKLFTSF